MNLQEKKKRVESFRLIDDIFFEVFAEDVPACQEMIRVILGDHRLIVKDVIVQSSERNLYGRSVRLDALCIMENGSLCNIEVQRSDNDNHLKRARFNGASITVKESCSGENFNDVGDVWVVYISEKDIIGDGLTTYHIDKVIRENGKMVDDGFHEIFVNASIDDGSEIADLMDCFMKTELDNPKFPAMTRRFQELKTTEGGLDAMCKIMQNLIDESNAKIIVSSVENIVKNLNFSTVEACKVLGYSLESYETSVALISTHKDS